MAVAQVEDERRMLGIRVPEDIIEALDEEAKRLRRSRNHIILECIETRLGYVDGRPPVKAKKAAK
jgi:predicted transcriptional regulator